MSSDSDNDVETGSEQSSTDINVPLKGKIYSVNAQNFITFTDSTIYPGDELNILIGPNGTGKSSMVAAIVIGMGGTTKVLSAAKMHLSNYVKNGKDRATVTICLYKNENGDLYTFSRSFGLDNKSIYKIDGKKVTGEEYLAVVHGMNIQVDNLCQFLPQDRVQDFAKQNPQELFRSTQLSVCKEETFGRFEKLIEMREHQVSGSSRQEKNAAQLQEMEQRLVVLSEAVKMIEERDRMNTRCDIIRKKLAWMDFEKSYKICKEIEADLKLADEKFKQDDKKHKELVKNAEEITVERKRLETKHQSEIQKRRKCDDELDRIIGEMDALKEAIKKVKNDLAHAKRSAVEHEKEVDECRLIESAYKTEYEQMVAQSDPPEVHRTKLQAIDDELAKVSQNVERFNAARTKLNQSIDSQKRNVLAIDNKLKAAENEKERRAGFLKERYPDTYKAMMWLRENREMFRGEVYDPIMMELSVSHIEHAKYIETAIGARDLIAFLCTNVDDMNLLMRKLRNEQRLKCNVVHSAAATAVQHRPSAQISSLQHLGARSFLIDSVQGPAPIINYLCKIYNIQNTIIGVDDLERNWEQLPQWVRMCFTTNDRIAINKSRYTSDRSMFSNAINRNNIFNDRISPQELEKMKRDRVVEVKKMDEHRNKRKEIETAIEAREADYRQITQKRNELTGAKGKLQEAEKKLAMQSDKLNRLIRSGIDVDAEAQKCQIVSQQSIRKLLQFQANAVNVYEKLVAASSCEDEAKHRLEKFKNVNASIEVQIMTSNEARERSKSYVDRIGRKLDSVKEECKKKRLDAAKLTNNRSPLEGDKFPFKKQFAELSDNEEELKDDIAEIEAQLECQTAPQHQTVQEYEDRKRKLEQLKKEIANSDRMAANAEREMAQLHNKWFPVVQKVVESINRNFSRFMATMNCAGEVELIRQSEHDYRTYGIEIRVKYRSNERLRPLDRMVQSGGERAVAIAVYSLSLQHLSQVPFRCVDEINQGMDSYNERRVFDMLVKIVAREHQSQFFYVTPKLLSNLSYNDYVTCCIVNNGPHATHNNYFIENGDE